ncbi:MAG: hypothetical protein JO293_02330 [Candidatus Eremiobacteraeota bacterium]|nr:hypothetical protein [Candidatus Eremiobacteraeota bacterium]
MRWRAFLLAAACAAAIVAAAIQIVADGALGGVATALSVPHAVAATLGDGPARRIGLAPRAPAGDVLGVSAEVDRLDARGDYRAALALQAGLVVRLRGEGANREVLADALWRRGRLEAELGYREPLRRRVEWERALRTYQDALELVPLSVTILLAAGNQALLDGDRALAATYFERAVENDPSSAAARDGLHKAQTGQGAP